MLTKIEFTLLIILSLTFGMEFWPQPCRTEYENNRVYMKIPMAYTRFCDCYYPYDCDYDNTALTNDRNEHGGGGSGSETINKLQFPESVSSITVTSAFPNENLKVTWTAPTTPNGVIQYYLVYVKINEGSTTVGCAILKCSICSNIDSTEIQKLVTDCPSNIQQTEGLSTLLTVFNDDTKIKPYTDYTVYVIPRNGHGWGTSKSKTIKTSQYISEAVTFISVTVVFPDENLNVTWTAPTTPNGLIQYYLVYVKINEGSTTVGCAILKCSSCSNIDSTEIQKQVTDCSSNIQQIEGLSTLSTVFNVDTKIKPDTNYTVYVVPRNGYGWGKSKSKLIKTSQYTRLAKFSCLSPTSYTIQCSWKTTWSSMPQYVHFVLTIRNNTQIIYNVTQLSHTRVAYIDKNVVDGTRYICTLKLYFGTMLLDEEEYSVLVEKFIPPSIANMEGNKSEIENKISKVMENVKADEKEEDKIEDPTSQVMIVLPFSFFYKDDNTKDNSSSTVDKKEKIEIKLFTVVVASPNRKITKVKELDRNETMGSHPYEDCDMGRKCNYEVIPPNGRKGNSSKKDDWANSKFILGTDKTCVGKKEYECNGPLAPGESVKISFRAYSARGFSTFGEIKKTTKIAPKINMLYVLIGAAGVLLIIIIIGTVIYKITRKNMGSRTSQGRTAKETSSTTNATEMSLINSAGNSK